MKGPYKYISTLLSVIFLLPVANCFAQSPEKGDLSIAINYFVKNNQVPYLTVVVKTKVDGRFQFVSGIPLNLFLDKDSIGTRIGKVITNEKGEATAYIPLSVKKEWASSVKHTFLTTFDGNKKYDAAKADLTVGKAKILISTDDKTITATVLEMKDTAWTPVKGVDVILAMKRMDGDLLINETPTFTTDSTGKASGDFKRDKIHGDANGNITLVAKVVDNDQYGNLSIEKTVNWGAKFVPVNTFNERTLFATRSKAPIWLELIAYSIIFAVWGTLILLVLNLVKIKKMGQEVD